MKAFPNCACVIQWLGACLLCCQLQAANPTVPLLDAVEVKADEIRLSDLLPHSGLHQVSAPLALCHLGRMPALGTTRTLTRAQVEDALTRCSAVDPLSIPERIMVSRAGYPIREAAIRGALAKFSALRLPEKQLPSGDVEWPKEVEALDDGASLMVQSSRWDGLRRRWQLAMRCDQPQACGEFVVYLKPLAGSTSAQDQPAISPAAMKTTPLLTRPGQKATLLLEDGKVRISISVTCLQRGRLGEQIRVLDSAGRRVFRAYVLAPDLLRVASPGEL